MSYQHATDLENRLAAARLPIEQIAPGIDPDEDVSPHAERIAYIGIEMTTDEARAVRAVLAVYHGRGEDDPEHLQLIGSALRKLRFGLGEKA